MRAILLKGISAYGVLDAFIDELANALKARGFENVIIDLGASGKKNPFPELEAARAAGPISFAFSFSVIGRIRDAGRGIGDVIDAPHIVQFVDYPLTHTNRLDLLDPACAVLTVDDTHIHAIRSVYGYNRFAFVGFSPHAAIGEPAPAEADPAAFAKARPIPVLFAGTCHFEKQPPWAALKAPGGRKIFNAAFEIARAAEFIPALDALDQVLATYGLDPADPSLRELRKGARLIHEYIRQTRRIELLKAVAKAGIQMHVYGAGYEDLLCEQKNVTLGGEASFDDVLALMRQSRVVLNANANFGAGSHERPLTALMAGAAAATDYSRFYAKRFSDGEDLLMLRWKALGQGIEKLAALSGSPEAAYAMARAGQARVSAEHRWANRVDTLLQAADVVRERMTIAGEQVGHSASPPSAHLSIASPELVPKL